MKKEFVPYQPSLDMKELGFDEPCIARYCTVTEWEKPTGEMFLQLQDCMLSDKNLTKAPLYQQAFRWFREKYGLHYPIQIQGNLWFFEKWSLNGFKTYEDAELACLKKLIEIVKEK